MFSAVLLVVGGIIGSGIFFTPAETARALPTAGLVFLVWAIGGGVALAGALTYAELGAMMPDAGGAYVYIREAFGKLPAFLYGWMVLLSIGTGALAAVASPLTSESRGGGAFGTAGGGPSFVHRTSPPRMSAASAAIFATARTFCTIAPGLIPK